MSNEYEILLNEFNIQRENDTLLIKHYETLQEIKKNEIELAKRNLKLEIDVHYQKKQDCLQKLDELQKEIEELTREYNQEKEYQENLERGKTTTDLQIKVTSLKKEIAFLDIENEAIEKKIQVTKTRTDTMKKTNGELEKKLNELNDEKTIITNECRKLQDQRKRDRGDNGN